MSHYYFAYGSNMNPQRMASRGMRTERAVAGVLHDWRLLFNKRCATTVGTAYANVAEYRGEVTQGVLYQLTCNSEIARMDPFENWPHRYRREQLPIHVVGGEMIEAWVYIANPDWQQSGLKPQRWYLNHLLSGRPWLSPDYYQWLAATSCF